MPNLPTPQDDSLPLVSICIPAYNYASYVAIALGSAMAQRYANLEILVLDNASTDGTGDICEDLARRDRRVRVTHWTTNKPPAASHNALLQAARGAYVCMASADDLYYPDKTAAQVQLMQQNPQWGACFVLCDFINGDNSRIHGYAPTFATPMTPAQIAFGLLRSSCVCMPANLMRRSTIEQVGLFNPEVQRAFDYDYWLRIVKVAQIGMVPQKLMAYRIHGKNAAYIDQRTIARDAWRAIARHGADVIASHPDMQVPQGYLEDTLASQALGTGDWHAAQQFLVAKASKGGLSEIDVLRLTHCLLQQDRFNDSRGLLDSLVRGRSLALPSPEPPRLLA